MTGRRQLRAEDVLKCFRIVGECRELGADAAAWQTHLAEQVRVVLDAQVVIAGNTLHLEAGRRPVSLSTIRVGWRDDSAERAWHDYVESVPMQNTPEYARIIGTDAPNVLLTRDDIWDRPLWYRSRTFNERHLPSGIDDYILSIVAVPRLNLYHSLWAHRGVGAEMFTGRHRRMLSLLHNELGTHIGGALASACEPALQDLTRRQRDALDALLVGDSEKQIALRLGISNATAHEHVVSIYRHYGVNSRAELMARFVGRAPPAPRRQAEPALNGH
jgi:DNA-binding CsgD family transcriptional regulator